jgi:antibiotic biosynthesis monooxygenase (ABM) superfamily enzyme
MEDTMTDNMQTRQVPAWKTVLAVVLDFFMLFIGLGYLIAALTGGLSDGGFNLNGAPALALFALMIAYFVGLGRYGGGTIWQRILGTRRR